MRRALAVVVLAAFFAGGASAGAIENWLRSQVTPAAACDSRVVLQFGRDRRIPIAVLEAALEDEMACRQNRRRAWDLEQLLQEPRR